MPEPRTVRELVIANALEHKAMRDESVLLKDGISNVATQISALDVKLDSCLSNRHLPGWGKRKVVAASGGGVVGVGTVAGIVIRLWDEIAKAAT